MTSTGTSIDSATRTPQPAWPPDRRSSWRRVGVGLGIAFSLLLIAWGVLWVVSLLIRQDEFASTAVDEPFSQVVVDTDSGDVVLRGADDSGASVDQRLRWSLSKPVVTTDVRDDVLYVRGDCSGWELGIGCTLDLVIEVPTDTVVELVSGAGDIDVASVDGSVAVRTGSGDVLVEGVDGAVQTRTGSGDVRLDRVAGTDISAVSGSGDVSLDLAAEPEDVNVRTGSGDLDVRVPAGNAAYDVQVDTGSGDRTVDVATDPGSDRSISARTGSGDVTVTYG